MSGNRLADAFFENSKSVITGIRQSAGCLFMLLLFLIILEFVLMQW